MRNARHTRLALRVAKSVTRTILGILDNQHTPPNILLLRDHEDDKRI
jgi:hypothetical protein